MAPRRTTPRKAPLRGVVFLDRDGTINTAPEHRYITEWEQFRFLPGALGAIRKLRDHGMPVIVVSNQSGVGRGLMSKTALARITRSMRAEVRRAGGHMEAIYYCTHHPDDGCRCRKPHPGMLRKAARERRIDLKRSFLVGDTETDVLTARSAGCRPVLVLTGRQTRTTSRHLTAPPDRIVKDLPQAVRWILRETKSE